MPHPFCLESVQGHTHICCRMCIYMRASVHLPRPPAIQATSASTKPPTKALATHPSCEHSEAVLYGLHELSARKPEVGWAAAPPRAWLGPGPLQRHRMNTLACACVRTALAPALLLPVQAGLGAPACVDECMHTCELVCVCACIVREWIGMCVCAWVRECFGVQGDSVHL